MPIVTAFLLGGLRRGSVGLTLGVLAVFLAHESLLILLGHRGRRALGAEAVRARAWLAVLAVAALVAFAVALPGLDTVARGALLGLSALAGLLFGLISARREKTLFGEIVAAVALTGVSFPVALAGGAARQVALVAAVVWALGFSMAVLAVRGVIASTSTKPGGGPLASRISFGCAVAVLAVSASLAASGVVPGAVPLALTPFAAASVALFAAPPHARQLKKVGWALVLASTLAGVVLVAALRGS